MGEADTPRLSSTIEFPGVEATPSTLPAVTQTSPPPQPTHDPLSLPYTLPSRGLYYGGKCPGGSVVITPTRGAQEEILAGAQDNPAAALPALRHVAEQCIRLGGLAFNDLLLFDFTALLFHFLALSNGTDELRIEPKHGSCKPTRLKLPLTRLPCKLLRVAEEGEAPNWPPADEEDEMSVLAEMEARERAEAEGVGATDVVLPRDAAQEPFLTEKLPFTGDVVGWRYHRVSDLIRAEEFVARLGKGKMGSFLLASQIVSINGRSLTGALEATAWVSRQPSPVLNALREEMSLRDFGYDVTPEFTCKDCGGRFRTKLPLDGSIFRSRRRR